MKNRIKVLRAERELTNEKEKLTSECERLGETEDRVIAELMRDREYASSLLRGLANFQISSLPESETRSRFVSALHFGAAVLYAKNKSEMPTEAEEKIIEHIEVLECLCAFADRMYIARKESKLREFFSHEEYVRALKMAIKELRDYLLRFE